MITPKSIFLFALFLIIEANIVLAQSVKFIPFRRTEGTLPARKAALTPEKIQFVEKNLNINDGLDGVSGSYSDNENNLLAAVAFANTKQIILDGVYFYEKLILSNADSQPYKDGLTKLAQVAIQKRGATPAEVYETRVEARADYLLEADKDPEQIKHVKQIMKDLGEVRGKTYIKAIAQCWYDPSLESRNKVLELAKALVPKKPPFPLATYSALCDLCEKPLDDNALYVALTNVLDAYNRRADHNAVQLE